jgi:hypothetical protein
MRVLFIEPPSTTSISMLPPISLPVLKGFIQTKTVHDAKILDLVFHRRDWQHLVLEELIKLTFICGYFYVNVLTP